MDFEEFKEQVRTEVSGKLNAAVFLEKVPKNNGITLSGMVIRSESSNVSPTIYLDSYFEDYRKGADIGNIVDDICKTVHAHEFKGTIDLSGFLKFEKAKERIVFRLVNYDRNRERLAEIPHYLIFP